MLDHTSGHHDPKKLTQKINHHTSDGGSDGSIYHYFQWPTWKHTSCFYNSRAYRVRYSDSQRWYTLTKGHTKYLSDLWAMTAFCLKKQEESHHQHSMDNCLWSSGEVEILLTLREKKYVWDPEKKGIYLGASWHLLPECDCVCTDSLNTTSDGQVATGHVFWGQITSWDWAMWRFKSLTISGWYEITDAQFPSQSSPPGWL